MGTPSNTNPQLEQALREGGITEGAEIITRPGQVNFRHDRLQPPSDLYITADDALGVTIWNSQTAQQVVINARILTPREGIVPTSIMITPSTNRAPNTSQTKLPEGFLLSLTVSSTAAFTQRGQTFVQVSLQRFGQSGLGPYQVLVQDYTATGNVINFPPFQIRSPRSGEGFVNEQLIADPGAGTTLIQNVPANAIWRPLSLSFQLTTNKAAETQSAGISFQNSTGKDWQEFWAQVTQTTGATVRYSFSNRAGYFNTAVVATNVQTGIGDALLTSNDRIIATAMPFDATDTITNTHLVVEEWIQP